MANTTKLRRVGDFVLRYLQPAVWALLALGVAAFALLPLAAKTCYLDEKALLVGGAVPTVRQSGALDACLAVQQHLLAGGAPRDFVGLVRAAVPAAAPFVSSLKFHQHSFSTQGAVDSNMSSSSGGGGGRGGSRGGSSSEHRCSTLHTVVRSPRGEGNEGYVLMMPINNSRPAAAALAVAAGVAMAGHLQRSRWLAKDAVLLFADTAACGAEESAQAWLAAYNNPWSLFAFPRAGLLQQALVLEVMGSAPSGVSLSPDEASSAELSVHGSSGLLPNLDLYYLIKRNLDLYITLPVSLRASVVPAPRAVQRSAATLAAAGVSVGLVQPAAAQRYASELQVLAGFAVQLASGQPSGAHAAFLANQVDAATLTLRFAAAADRSPVPSSHKARQRAQLAANSALAASEMVLRTFNNLQERLHHSTALYVLVSPARFASIAAYLAPPACLLLAALAQLVVVSRTAVAATAAETAALQAPVWRSAWRRVATAHATAMAVGTTAAWAAGGGARLGDSWGQLLQQLLWAVVAGMVAAEGPMAMLASLQPDCSMEACKDASSSSMEACKDASSSSSRGGSRVTGGQVQRCARAAGLAVAMLQGGHLLMSQWVRCFAFLLLAVPLYALCPTRPDGGRSWVLMVGPLLLGGAAALWHLHWYCCWLADLLAPHLLLLVLF